MRKVKVIYEGGFDPEFDAKIRKAMEDIGGEEWASGFNLRDMTRDLCFDFKEEKEK